MLTQAALGADYPHYTPEASPRHRACGQSLPSPDGQSRSAALANGSCPRWKLAATHTRSAMHRIDVPMGSETRRISRASTLPTPASTPFMPGGAGSISTW